MTTVLTTSPGFGKHGRVPDLIAERSWTFSILPFSYGVSAPCLKT